MRNTHTHTDDKHNSTQAHKHANTKANKHTCTHTRAHIRAHIRAPEHTRRKVHTHTHTHTSAHKHTHTHTHMPTHAQTCTLSVSLLFSFSLSLSRSLENAHTHIHTYTHTHMFIVNRSMCQDISRSNLSSALLIPSSLVQQYDEREKEHELSFWFKCFVFSYNYGHLRVTLHAAGWNFKNLSTYNALQQCWRWSLSSTLTRLCFGSIHHLDLADFVRGVQLLETQILVHGQETGWLVCFHTLAFGLGAHAIQLRYMRHALGLLDRRVACSQVFMSAFLSGAGRTKLEF